MGAPSARQAVALLEDISPPTGRGLHSFPGEINFELPMSNNTMNAALRRLGYPSHVDTARLSRSGLDAVE